MCKNMCFGVWIMIDYTEKYVLTVIDDIKPAVKSVLDSVERTGILSEQRRYEIELVLNELLVNSFKHTKPSANEPVVLKDSFKDGRLSISVTDSGDGFEYNKMPSHAASEALLHECGRGLMLVRAFCQEVRYNNKGNSVEVEIAL